MYIEYEFQLKRFSTFGVMWKNGFFGLFFFRKKSIIGEKNKFFEKKVTQDTPRTNTDSVCKF